MVVCNFFSVILLRNLAVLLRKLGKFIADHLGSLHLILSKMTYIHRVEWAAGWWEIIMNGHPYFVTISYTF